MERIGTPTPEPTRARNDGQQQQPPQRLGGRRQFDRAAKRSAFPLPEKIIKGTMGTRNITSEYRRPHG